MHQLRSRLAGTADAVSAAPLRTKEGCRRQQFEGGPSLASLAIARTERRTQNQRRNDRYPHLVRKAVLRFRGRKSEAEVINVSAGGIMIESCLEAHIGEPITIMFEGFEPVRATVRWIKGGRIGLDVGEGGIELYEL
jgi:hypothetical protein